MVQNSDSSPQRLKVWLPLMFSIVLVGGMLIGTQLQQAPLELADKGEIGKERLQTGRLEELVRYIEAKYVDTVDRQEVVDVAIQNILKQLDPHSTYIPADQLKAINEQLEGNFEGIGIEFMMFEDTILVVTPLVGGPSESAGLLAGDRIVMIEDSLVAGAEAVKVNAINLLRGKKGTKVTVGVKRGKDPNLKYFTITRDEIPMHSVDVGFMLNETTGYIKINRFSATTYREFMERLEGMVKEHNMQDLVIDLRQNPGGYLQQATKILSQLFKEEDRLLVYTQGRSTKRSEYETTGKPFFDVREIAVLIDEGSASASEILAGAIQDWDRGVIIGRRSFGKGLVQEQYELKDGSALRLTVARYYTPSGRSIQKPYDDLDEYDQDVYERYETGELYSQDSIQQVDSTRFYTLRDKRTVYGGGGITPDIFVPLDTILLEDEFITLRPFLPQFAFRYLEDHRDEFNYDLKEFQALYDTPDSALEEFFAYVAQEDVEVGQLTPDAKRTLKNLLKARLARQLFQDKGFYSVRNQFDPIVQKALKALQHPTPLTYK